MECYRCYAVTISNPLVYMQQCGLCADCYQYASTTPNHTVPGEMVIEAYRRVNNRLRCGCGVGLQREGLLFYYNATTASFSCSQCSAFTDAAYYYTSPPTIAQPAIIPEPPVHEHDDSLCPSCATICASCPPRRTRWTTTYPILCENCGYCHECSHFCSASSNTCCECIEDHFHCNSCQTTVWYNESDDEDCEYCNYCYRQERARRRAANATPITLEPCLFCAEEIQFCFCAVSV